MKMNRRQFVIGTTGATAAVVASTSALAAVTTKAASEIDVIKSIVARRFPSINVQDKGVSQFAKALLSRGINEKGTSQSTLAQALNNNDVSVDLERFVIREFVLNTNVMQRTQAGFNGIVYKDDLLKTVIKHVG